MPTVSTIRVAPIRVSSIEDAPLALDGYLAKNLIVWWYLQIPYKILTSEAGPNDLIQSMYKNKFLKSVDALLVSLQNN